MRISGRRHGRGSLGVRLADLERIYGRALTVLSEASREAIAAEARAKVREILARRGVAQQPHESLFEAFARALGLTPWELRARLAQRGS